VSGFQQCISLQEDSTAGFTQYMARLNESLDQLSTVQPMTLSDIYALAALMVLHLSESSRLERAYRDLMTFIDEGNALTLEEVLKVGLKYSRDLPSTANAYHAMRYADAVCNCACPLCCKRGRSPQPASRNSSSSSSRQGSPRPGAPRSYKAGDISTFLCNILTDHGIQPKNLPTTDMNDAFALKALFEEFHLTCLPGPRLPLTPTTRQATLHLILMPLRNVRTWTSYTESCLFGGLSLCLFCPYVCFFLLLLGRIQPLFATRWSSPIFI